MSFKGIEPIIFHWQSLLETHMPTKIAALNATVEDFVLPGIAAVYVGGSDGRALWPSAWLSEDDPENMAPYSGGGYLGYPIRMDFLDCDDGSGFTRLEQRLWRYQRLALDIVSEHKIEAGYWIGVSGVLPMSAPPVPLEENESQFAAVKGLRFWCISPEIF